jgi:MFS family permease
VRVARSELILSAVSLVDSLGSGLYLAGGVLFFTKIVGFSVGQVGIGLSLAGIFGFAALAPAGWIADRIGPRRTLTFMNLWRAAGFCLYIFTGSFWQFFLIAALLSIGDQTCHPLYQAVVEQAARPGQRVALMARLRTMYNVGYTLGAGLATVALVSGSRTAFTVIFLANAASFVVAALALTLTNKLLGADGRSAPQGLRGMRLTALRDRAYLRISALNGLLSLHISILGVAVPLWAVYHTSAPRAIVGPLLIVNTVLAVALQARVARDTHTVGAGITAMRRAGLALISCCLLFALASMWDTGGAVAGLVGAVALMTAGELFQSAGGWSLSYGLAPQHARAEYLATFSLGASAQYIVGPAIVTVGVIEHGTLGWLGLAACFAITSLLAGPAVTAAERSREPRHGIEPTVEVPS